MTRLAASSVAVTLLRAPGLLTAGLQHAFPTRDTPDGELATELGAGPIAQVHQVHGARAVAVTRLAQARALEADAIVARASDGKLAVGVRVADCVPVLVADLSTGDVAAIHAGWRGVVTGVVAAGVRELVGAAPASPWRARDTLVAAIGPCIGPCCFEVGRDVGERIGFVVGAGEAGDKVFVDLRAAVRAQLAALGVTRVDDVPGCTKHEPERFHSFRRDGAHSGRMLAAIATRR
jgi:YfiH family protein